MRFLIKMIMVVFFITVVTLFVPHSFAMEIRSTAFKNNENIPLKYTGLSYNMSPPLIWSDLPQGTKSLVLIVDDPDAAIRTCTHWVVYDIPAEISMLKANMPARGLLPNGIRQGKNSFYMVGYGGPYPPPGPPHRYVFTLYALDVFLDIPPGEDKNTVLLQMKGHVLDKTELIGIFGR